MLQVVKMKNSSNYNVTNIFKIQMTNKIKKLLVVTTSFFVNLHQNLLIVHHPEFFTFIFLVVRD